MQATQSIAEQLETGVSQEENEEAMVVSVPMVIIVMLCNIFIYSCSTQYHRLHILHTSFLLL